MLGAEIIMTEPENRLFCRLDGLTPEVREQKRLGLLRQFDLIEADKVAVFDEATQTAAQFLDVPISILSIMKPDCQLIKSAVGLSTLGLMNELAESRQIPRRESFCSYVVDSHQVLGISDTATHPIFARSLLVGYYGIRSYLGVPLLTRDGDCLGTLAVMDVVSRSFTASEIKFLEMTARWSFSEFDRNRLMKQQSRIGGNQWTKSIEVSMSELEGDESQNSSQDIQTQLSSLNSIKVKLVAQLTQELRTPLTSIMGMASVLNRKIYGPLTGKQKEYIEIIHESGQHLVSMIEEIVSLGLGDSMIKKLSLTPVDIEMISQQVINSLSGLAKQHQKQLRLSIEPGNRIWFLDKEKVRQMLYYLVFSMIYSAVAGSEIRVHISRKRDELSKRSGDDNSGLTDCLQIAVWISHPWLGESLPQLYRDITELPVPLSLMVPPATDGLSSPLEYGELTPRDYLSSNQMLSDSYDSTAFPLSGEPKEKSLPADSREHLGLLLSYHLAQQHGGKLSVQGLSESGYRYAIRIPKLEQADERL